MSTATPVSSIEASTGTSGISTSRARASRPVPASSASSRSFRRQVMTASSTEYSATCRTGAWSIVRSFFFSPRMLVGRDLLEVEVVEGQGVEVVLAAAGVRQVRRHHRVEERLGRRRCPDVRQTSMSYLTFWPTSSRGRSTPLERVSVLPAAAPVWPPAPPSPKSAARPPRPSAPGQDGPSVWRTRSSGSARSPSGPSSGT